MTDKLPRITADKLIPILEKKGFTLVRQSGSHKIWLFVVSSGYAKFKLTVP